MPDILPANQAPSTAKPVTALVLAGGLSRRMGSLNKLLASINSEVMVRTTTRQALASLCDRVVVVLGHEAEQVQRALSGLKVDFVVNSDYREGLGASVRAGAHAVQAGHAVLVCLGDMPDVDAGIMNALIQAYRSGSPQVCQPVYAGKRGNPVLWAAERVADLRQMEGDEGARQLIQRHVDALCLVPVDTAGVVQDIDTPQDLARRRGMDASLT